MRALDLASALCAALVLAACASDPAATAGAGGADAGAAVDGCALLFGRPNAKTGLGEDKCRPVCSCGGVEFAPPDYDEAFAKGLVDGYVEAHPSAPLAGDPYAGPTPAVDPDGTVCAVVLGDAAAKPRPYDLVTYPSEEAARAAGAKVTHFGRCGVCSSLANLATYVRQNDLTAPVRECGLSGGSEDEHVACLQALGFERPCAQAWYWDTVHTKEKCLGVCLAELANPYQRPDGTLNPCVQCDEDESGAVFKAVAGRTRRNSGLPNALCRPCSEVRPLVHAY